MLKKIKKFFSSAGRFLKAENQQKGVIVIPLAVYWIGSAIISIIAGSWIGNLDLGEKIATWIFLLLFSILGTITIGFAGLAIAILNYVLSPDFVSLDYTNRTNPIIDAGLSVTMSFVNMILVLVLIYIALATILRLAGYETKKLLITFVIVALLVNFAPVICGLIVDASNIVMNYFTKNISTFLTFSDRLSQLWGDFLGAPPWAEKAKLAEGAAKALAITIFGAFAGLIFLLFSVVFIVRYIAIWLLVILSPLAFACYILPATKKYWNLWWNQFLQWSFVGVTMSFFLYLATILLSKVDMFKNPNIGNAGTQINILLTYLAPLAFLYLGFIVGISTSAFGASAVMNLTKKYGKKGALYGAAGAGTALRGIPQISRAEEAIRRRMERVPLLGRVIGGPGAFEKGRAGRMETEKKAIESIPDTPEGNKAILERIQRLPLTDRGRHERAAGIEILAKRKALTDEARGFLPEAQRLGANAKTIYMARPDFAPDLIDPKTKLPMTVEEIMTKIEPGEFWKNVQKDAFKNNEVVLQTGLHPRMVELGRNAKKDLKKEFKSNFKAMTTPSGLTKEQKKALKNSAKHLAGPNWQV